MLLMLLLAAGTMVGHSQTDCFTYYDNEATIITGLSGTGMAATELTIPSTVTTVQESAFCYANSKLSSLTIDGGNPAFESGLFGEKTSTLTYINMGSGMSATNMYSLLTSLGSRGALQTVEIGGYSDGPVNWTDETIKSILVGGVDGVRVIMPAALVADQVFGDATVYGRFVIDKELITFCGNVTFQDVDNGSNMLFYVADRIEDQQVHIQRVHYIAAGQGVLIHKTASLQGYADLPRVSAGTSIETDAALYTSNMLVGVTEPTNIDPTGDNCTNYVLKDGAFHPVKQGGGNIAANKAYLRLPTTSQSRTGSFSICFPDDVETEISELAIEREDGADARIYDLQGRCVDRASLKKGLYIVDGRKFMK